MNDFFDELDEQENHIYCRCGNHTADRHSWLRYDAYGIPTGHWCDECYNSDRYPYRRDRYEYWEYGERLEDDY